MPKLLKSLFPVRDEKRGKQPSPLANQVKASGKQQWTFLTPGGMILRGALTLGGGGGVAGMGGLKTGLLGLVKACDCFSSTLFWGNRAVETYWQSQSFLLLKNAEYTANVIYGNIT